MQNIWTIAKREFNNYFSTPLAYVISAGLLLALGLYCIALLWSSNSQIASYGFANVPDPGQISGLFSFLMLLVVPALTMRLISDEARSGTLELLLTAPVRDYELVIGKWLGSFLFMLSLIAVSLIFPLIINNLVDPGIDQVKMMSSYLGLILIAASLLALGTGISALFQNPIVSYLVTFLGVFLPLYWLLGLPGYFLPGTADFFRYLTMNTHFDSTFNSGVLYLSDLIYFLSLIAIGLFTGTVAVESRRWR